MTDPQLENSFTSITNEINKISAYVHELEEENSVLKTESEKLKNKLHKEHVERERLKDYLIELIAPDILKLKAHEDVLSDRLGEIYRTYRKLCLMEGGAVECQIG